ncbi:MULTISPECIES: PH domain-containing protein [unclassified Lysinibacillus]|uniref:PH domain-containing protein n=1 Tax=unclassified Lysinibacillus TaxID=2636778 RepID=UPI0038134063
MAKALNCPNCAAALNPKENNCEYCGSYIITSEAKQVTYDLNEFKPTYTKIFFHEIEMGVNELPIRSGVANMYYSASKSDGGRLLLTNKRLIFCAHAVNINPNLYWEVSLNNIGQTELGLNLLISQRILIFDREGKETTFVVYGGKSWINEINKALK